MKIFYDEKFKEFLNKMSRNSCRACSPCLNRNYKCCDKCDAKCCIDNIQNHKEMFRLGDLFQNKVKYAFQNLYDKCISVYNNLNNHNIYIFYDQNNSIESSENYLNSIKNEKNKIEKNRKDLEDNILTEEKEYEIKKQKITYEHDLNLQNIENEYNEKNKKYEKFEEKIKEINLKQEKKHDLENIRDNIGKDKNIIIDNFTNEQKENFEKQLNEEKNKIEESYVFKEIKFEYSQKDIEQKNEYIEEIKKIKEYSNKIPNYDNWMMIYGLNKIIS